MDVLEVDGEFLLEDRGVKIGFIFWLLMILWLVLGLYMSWPQAGATFGLVGGNLLLFVLLFLLGWKAFGLPIQN